MNTSHTIHNIIQYALLIAGQEDDFKDRSLGPIHLLKYVYLADLVYAASNNGETYTGIKWQFYKFGPWSQEVHSHIEPALALIGADHKIFESTYEGKSDWHRWSIVDDDLLADIRDTLPPVIAFRLTTFVHKYGANTPQLLDFVYNTPPMRHAAPNDYLDFTTAVSEVNMAKEDFTPMLKQLSVKKKKTFRQRAQELRKKVQKRQEGGETWKKDLIRPAQPPRYDNTFFEGIMWLDSSDLPSLPKGKTKVAFENSVWKASIRTEKDVF